MLRIRYMSSQPKAKPLKRKPGKKRKIIYTAYYAKNTGHKCTARHGPATCERTPRDRENFSPPPLRAPRNDASSRRAADQRKHLRYERVFDEIAAAKVASSTSLSQFERLDDVRSVP